MQQLWFSIFDFSGDYKGTEPAFIDHRGFDWAKEIGANAEVIKQEFDTYFSAHDLQPYFNEGIVSRKKTWKTVALKTWSVELYKNQKYFPVTTSILNKYPQIISASFNLLDPHSRIIPHCGDTNAIYRCHLGLEIPVSLPTCGFRVKEEQRSWNKGEWLVFMDAYVHEAWNDSDQPRFIFLMDVLRPEFETRKQKVVSTVLTSLFLQKRAATFSFLKKESLLLRKTLVELLRPFASLSVFISNTFRIY